MHDFHTIDPHGSQPKDCNSLFPLTQPPSAAPFLLLVSRQGSHSMVFKKHLWGAQPCTRLRESSTAGRDPSEWPLERCWGLGIRGAEPCSPPDAWQWGSHLQTPGDSVWLSEGLLGHFPTELVCPFSSGFHPEALELRFHGSFHCWGHTQVLYPFDIDTFCILGTQECSPLQQQKMLPTNFFHWKTTLFLHFCFSDILQRCGYQHNNTFLLLPQEK